MAGGGRYIYVNMHMYSVFFIDLNKKKIRRGEVESEKKRQEKRKKTLRRLK